MIKIRVPKLLLLFHVSILFWFSACKEAAFRTPLEDIPVIQHQIPEAYEGTFLYADETAYEGFRQSGAAPDEFMAKGLELEPDWLSRHKIYSLHIMPGGNRLVFGNLLPFAEDRIDSGHYEINDFHISWERVLENVLHVRIDGRDQADTSILMPVWKAGDMYFTVESLSTNGASAEELEGYELSEKLDSLSISTPTRWDLEPTLLKEHNGSHYLIQLRDDGYFQIEQFHPTESGFTRRTISELRIPEEADQQETMEFSQTLGKLRKVVPADTVGDLVVIDPKSKDLDKLFQSSFAKTEYFIRIYPERASGQLVYRLALMFGSVALAALIYVIIRGRRKS